MFKFKFYIPETFSEEEFQKGHMSVIKKLGDKIGVNFNPDECQIDHATYQSLSKFQKRDESMTDDHYDYLIVKSIYNKSYLVFDSKNEKFIDIRF